MRRGYRGFQFSGASSRAIEQAVAKTLHEVAAVERQKLQGAAPVAASAVVLGHHSPATGTRVLLQDGTVVQVQDPKA